MILTGFSSMTGRHDTVPEFYNRAVGENRYCELVKNVNPNRTSPRRPVLRAISIEKFSTEPR
jgi:hypothetical protein